jgi:hypothetical protein
VNNENYIGGMCFYGEKMGKVSQNGTLQLEKKYSVLITLCTAASEGVSDIRAWVLSFFNFSGRIN